MSIIDSIDGTLNNFATAVKSTIYNVLDAVQVGQYDKQFTQSGFSFDLGRTGTAGASVQAYPNSLYPKSFSVGSQAPVGNVIVKKRIFTTLKNSNDTKYLDATEKDLIRTTKRLFQLKAFQLATYEALTKFQQVLQNENTLSVPYLISMLQNASAFGALGATEVSSLTSTLTQILERDLVGQDTNFTTWFIDKFSLDVADIGNGIGVLEFTNFTNMRCDNNMSGSAGTGSVSFEDPYHIMMISNEDIELAIADIVYDGVNSTISLSANVQDLADNLNSFKNNSNNNNVVLQAEANAAINTINNVAQSTFNVNNFETPEQVAYIRKKLRKFYLGKSIIQPTDAIYFFVKSDTTYENDQDPVGLPLSLDRYSVDEEILKQEMYAVTKDKNFDINVYRSLRDPNAFSGACIFTGVVSSVIDNFNDGFYTLDVNCKNNLWYLEQSFVNVEPSLDQSQGFLHDPLTPFKLDFDTFGNIKTQSLNNSSTPGLQLLDDNITLLNSLNITYETGSKRGNQVTANNIYTGNYPGTEVQQIEHFPGMLYRWKEGIATLSSPITASDQSQFFLNNKLLVNNVYGLALTSTPFDSMDAANVVSLLVTGLPYNMNTFVENSLLTGATNFISRPDSRGDLSAYFNNFFDIFQKQNKIFGNFKPLLDMKVNIDNIKQIALKKLSINALDKKIGQLEQNKLDLTSRLNALPKNDNAAEGISTAKVRQGLQAELDGVNNEQRQLIANFNDLDNTTQSLANGNDSLGFSNDPDERAQQMNDYQNRQIYVSNKRIEDVRFNRDINYFIVGTEYSADLDIQAFALNLRNNSFKLFDNTYEPVLEKALTASGAINFEFFADNSGNIRFRAPQYNKVPLSIYYNLFMLEGQNGVNIVPDFVKNLFTDQVSGLKNSIIALNWQILLELGKDGSDEIIKTLNATIQDKTSNIVNFLGNPRIDATNNNFSLDDGDITNQLIEFNSATQVNVDQMISPVAQTTHTILDLTMIQNIANQLNNTFSINITINADDLTSPNEAAAVSKRQILFQNIKRLSSERNSQIKQLRNQLSNLGIDPNNLSSNNLSSQELSATTTTAIANQKAQLQQEILQVVMSGNSQGYTRPQISPEYASIIEDDTRNYIGRGSGRRFILRDDMIKSSSFEEQQPDYCRIDVQGTMNLAPGFSQSELRMLWAGGVDYDSWRMYGFKQGQAVTVPYLHDPESQLKPYAVFLLSQQRKKVLRGSVSLVGNEYYQLGDVVYVPDRDLLFYVTGVSQDFTNGEDFSTRLTLEYGRAPGEYIPTPLDVIGKTLVKQTTANLTVTKRQVFTDTLYFPIRSLNVGKIKAGDTGDDATNKLLGIGTNQGYLVNALINANLQLQKPNVNLIVSGFNLSGSNTADITARINAVIDWLVSPKLLMSNSSGSNLVNTDYQGIDRNKIKPNTLDLNNTTNKATSDQKPNDNLDIVSSDNISTIESIKNTNNKMMNASQESHSVVNNPITDLDQVIEIGIQFLSDSSGNNNIGIGGK